MIRSETYQKNGISRMWRLLLVQKSNPKGESYEGNGPKPPNVFHVAFMEESAPHTINEGEM